MEERLWPRIAYPSQRAVRSAQRFAAGWGDVSFAVIGRSSDLRGYQVTRTYSSASASRCFSSRRSSERFSAIRTLSTPAPGPCSSR